MPEEKRRKSGSGLKKRYKKLVFTELRNEKEKYYCLLLRKIIFFCDIFQFQQNCGQNYLLEALKNDEYMAALKILIVL